MQRSFQRIALGLIALVLAAGASAALGAGQAAAADPTEPPPCGNSGQPCEPTGQKPVPPPSESSPQGGSGSSGGAGSSGNSGGQAPSVSIGSAELSVGVPVPVLVSFVGGSLADSDLARPITVEISVSSGSVAIAGGTSGATATIQAPFAALRSGIPGLTVTAGDAGPVAISVRAYPADRPGEGIAGSRELIAPIAQPSPTMSATADPTAIAEVPTDPVLRTAANGASEAGVTPALTVRSITLPRYRALDKPTEVVDTTIAVVVVLGVVGLSAGALAGGVPLPSPSSPSPSSSPASPADDSQRRRAESAGHHQAGRDRAHRSEGSLANLDASFEGIAAAVSTAGIGDRLRTWRLPLTNQVDATHHVSISAAARLSPLMARLLADNTYLRAMFGSGALLLPVTAVVLAVMAVIGVNGLALAPSATILGLITLIGTLDAMAGFAAFITFAAGVAILGGITGADSVRTLLGLGIIGFGPALIAGAARPLRRPAGHYDGWERITDFVIIPLIGAFAVQSMVSSLAGLSGYDLPIVSSANVIALIALVGLVLRVSLEELAARAFPGRLAQVAPAPIPPRGLVHRLLVALMRTAVFVFVAVAFIGQTWQLWAGAAIFAAAQVCEILGRYAPNSPRLFHVVPVGVPRLVLVLLISLGVTTSISLLLSDGPDYARTSFVLLMLPGLALASLGMFGREPREGDTRWYLRDAMRVWYRIGGAILVVAAVYMTQFT